MLRLEPEAQVRRRLNVADLHKNVPTFGHKARSIDPSGLFQEASDERRLWHDEEPLMVQPE